MEATSKQTAEERLQAAIEAEFAELQAFDTEQHCYDGIYQQKAMLEHRMRLMAKRAERERLGVVV